MTVRVRFAPSPTGYPHLGNIRTALFNWLFARHHNGNFILRVEDTDVTRKVEGAIEAMMDSLRWLNMDWDEGPYYQSQRLSLYQETAHKLIEGGYAYPCYCSPERLEAVRREQMRQKQPPKYDEHCRNLTQSERVEMEARGIKPVVRLKVPHSGETTFEDLIRGQITFNNDTIGDLVLLKSDGYPTYHLANVVDDHLMNITHVLRADEWVSSTPRHILIYQALNWQPPQFAHLPMILGPDKSKLSKRHGATAINEYREQGYLPDAMINFLTLLGWSLDDHTELLSRDQLIQHFSLERVSKTGAVFDKVKLEWMNGVYLRKLGIEEYTKQAMSFLERDLPPSVTRPLDTAYVNQIMPLVQERAKTLAEIPQLVDFFFLDDLSYNAHMLVGKGMDAAMAASIIEVALQKLTAINTWDSQFLESYLRQLSANLNLNTGKLFSLLRTAVTGRTATPPLFQTMAVLGKETCLGRIRAARDRLSTLQ